MRLNRKLLIAAIILVVLSTAVYATYTYMYNLVLPCPHDHNCAGISGNPPVGCDHCCEGCRGVCDCPDAYWEVAAYINSTARELFIAVTHTGGECEGGSYVVDGTVYALCEIGCTNSAHKATGFSDEATISASTYPTQFLPNQDGETAKLYRAWRLAIINGHTPRLKATVIFEHKDCGDDCDAETTKYPEWTSAQVQEVDPID